MIAFAAACDAVAATPAKLEKIALVAEYLQALGDDDLSAAARFFTGDPFAPSEGRTLSVGGRTIVAAAAIVWGVRDDELRAAYRATGDLGAALGRFARPPLDLGLDRASFTPAALKGVLDAIADARGRSAARRRLALCEQILGGCRCELEARYAIKLLAGELRIGLRRALVEDAIARAFGREAEAVRRATMATGDVGAVAVAARHDELGHLGARYGSPVGFMLAAPLAFRAEYDDELGAHAWLVEDKFDGVRAQAHKHGNQVGLFSRAHSEIGGTFPEVVADLRRSPGDFIVDGEIVAVRDGRVLPFRRLQTRLARKDPSEALRAEVPVQFVAFDALAIGGSFLIDLPLAQRRAALETAIAPGEFVTIAPSEALGELAAGRVNERFELARARGNEGLVLKRADSAYVPGRRGQWWRKLKRELSTLDVVVVAVEWGHGKRHRVLSDYTFAVRAAPGDDRLLTIGKAFTGLTDAEIVRMTQWFLAHGNGNGSPDGFGFAVEPEIVIEIAFDVIMQSTLHDSGYSLRFPRIVRLRPDKPASEIDTLADVERIYGEMLAREGVEPAGP